MNLFILFTIIFLFLSAEPISRKDREFIILYTCNIEGDYNFSNEGQKGLATISELKKVEELRETDHRGGVFLFSAGSFLTRKESLRGHFDLMNKVGFDGVFVTENELKYIEANPILKKLNLPIISHRETELDYKQSLKFQAEGINFRVGHILETVEDLSLDFELIFPHSGNLDYISVYTPIKPTYFFLNQKEISHLSFTKKNLYSLQCPDFGNLGKLRLFFRGKKLIRQKQELIPLNTIEINSDWISPDRNIIKNLE